jgi:hypothetical protein
MRPLTKRELDALAAIARLTEEGQAVLRALRDQPKAQEKQL